MSVSLDTAGSHDLRKPDRVGASKIEKKRDPLMQRRVKKKKGG